MNTSKFPHITCTDVKDGCFLKFRYVGTRKENQGHVFKERKKKKNRYNNDTLCLKIKDIDLELAPSLGLGPSPPLLLLRSIDSFFPSLGWISFKMLLWTGCLESPLITFPFFFVWAYSLGALLLLDSKICG